METNEEESSGSHWQREPLFTKAELEKIYKFNDEGREQIKGKMRGAVAILGKHATARFRGEQSEVDPEHLDTAMHDYQVALYTAHLMHQFGGEALLHDDGVLADKFQRLGDEIHKAGIDSFTEAAPDVVAHYKSRQSELE